MTPIRDRIIGLERVKASTLRPHPLNFRRHPEPQRAALRGLLAEIGFADAVLVRRSEDGALTILDGHLRVEEMGDADVPVLILDVDAHEAEKMLATLDPLAAMADTDAAVLADLLARVETQDDGVRAMLQALTPDAPDFEDGFGATGDVAPALGAMTFRVTVTCRDEAHQRALIERFQAEGLEVVAVVT